MGKFDAADVIKAAATSNLGVISLIVLVLAFLAWRFFQQSSDNVKLVAFATMFLGAVGFVAAVMLAGGDAPKPEPKPSEVQASATPSAAAATSAEVQAAPHGPGDIPDIGGAWHDSDGYSYRFSQDGDAFTYETTLKGQVVGSGAGTIAGTQLSYRYTQTGGGGGTCDARLSADAKTIDGRCRDGGAQWEFSIQR